MPINEHKKQQIINEIIKGHYTLVKVKEKKKFFRAKRIKKLMKKI